MILTQAQRSDKVTVGTQIITLEKNNRNYCWSRCGTRVQFFIYLIHAPSNVWIYLCRPLLYMQKQKWELCEFMGFIVANVCLCERENTKYVVQFALPKFLVPLCPWHIIICNSLLRGSEDILVLPSRQLLPVAWHSSTDITPCDMSCSREYWETGYRIIFKSGPFLPIAQKVVSQWDFPYS